MLNSIKRIAGIKPNQVSRDVYSPSSVALKMATAGVDPYEKFSYEKLQETKRTKVLVLCTEQSDVPMTNGTYFSSGNHIVETFVPLLHLKDAGFDFEFYTPTGKPAQFELWSMPKNDSAVEEIFDECRKQIKEPKSLEQLAEEDFKGLDDVIAIYIPGGHGALLGLPTDENVGNFIKWAHDNDVFHISICHGPAALLSTAQNGDFIYEGYEIAAFPDTFDRITPLIGYMPGQLTWFFGKELQDNGIKIVNHLADGVCHVDRKLITGASPQAANNLGRLAGTTLVKYLNN